MRALVYENSLPRLDHWAIPKTRILSDVEEIPDEANTRFNDVIADPRGRVFCGTLSSGDRPGRLYRLDPDHSLHVVLEGGGSIAAPTGAPLSKRSSALSKTTVCCPASGQLKE